MAMDGNDPENTRVIHNTPYPTDRGDNADNENAWAWGVLNRCGVALLGNNPIQGNTPFQHQDRATFSPLPTNPMSIEGAMVALLMFKLLKDKPEMFERIVIKYLDSCARIVESVEESCHSNWLTALNNQHIAVGISHRIGLIDDAAYTKTLNHYQSVFDKMWQAQMAGHILEGITTFVGQTKVGGGEKGTAATGLGALANILSAKKGS